VVGHPFNLAQVNYSVSRRGTLRGIHGVALPPGQAKLVTCVRGSVLDIVVDLRVGSPTFGAYDVTPLDAASGVAVYVAEGLGHAFVANTDGVCVSYLCSTPYGAAPPFSVNPLDPQLDLPWPDRDHPLMSTVDSAAPTLAEAAEKGLLATYDECLKLYQDLRSAG
jgi:dTDP-4-dehydrorhamnose 3,5-epimerase